MGGIYTPGGTLCFPYGLAIYSAEGNLCLTFVLRWRNAEGAAEGTREGGWVESALIGNVGNGVVGMVVKQEACLFHANAHDVLFGGDTRYGLHTAVELTARDA